MINETLDLEEAILGVLLTDSTYMEQLVLDEKYFQNPLSKKILELLKKQYSEYHTIDLTGLVSNYRSYFEGGNSISVDYLVEISIRGLPNQFEYYQDSLFRLFIRKLLLYEIQKFQSGKINQEELLDSIHELEQKTISKKSDSLTGAQIYNLITQKKQKIMFQYPKLTNAANIQENDLIVIAARPGIGKTGFALNLLNYLSETYKCLYFNMEMTEQQLYRRLVSINCKVPMMEHDSLQNSTESFLKKEQLKRASDDLSKKKIEIVTGGQTIRTIRSKIIKESVKEHLIVFIDYIGLIRDIEKNRSNYERVTDITKELRQISLDYNCTIFVLAQINRNSEKEKNKEPKISDLKESGELEQSATTVLMLHNENVYKSVNCRGKDVYLIIGKNRNGLTGKIQFEYHQDIQYFKEYEKK